MGTVPIYPFFPFYPEETKQIAEAETPLKSL
jgi:hypothetical protein